MKEFINKHSKVISLLLIVFLVSLFGLTFAYTMQDIGVNIASGNYNVIYSGSATLPTGTLNPVVDSSISATTSSTDVMKVTFSVKGAQSNPTDIPIIYDVTLTDLDMPSELRHPLLKWRLYKNSNLLYEGSFEDVKSNRYILTSTQQNLPTYSASPDNYVFIVWISEQCTGDITTCSVDDSNDISGLLNKSFSGKIRIELSTKGKTSFDRNALAYQTLEQLGLSNNVKTRASDTFTKPAPSIKSYKADVKQTNYTRTSASSYYYTYADSYTFSLSGYTLTSPSVGKYSDIYKNLVGKYIVTNSGNTSSSAATSTNISTIYYVVDATYDSSLNEGKITYIAYKSQARTSSTSLYRYTASDNYTFDSSTGKFSLDNPSVLQYSTSYSNLINKYVVNYSGSSSTTAATSTNLSSIYKILDAKYTSGASTPGRLSYVEYSRSVNEYDYSDDGIYASVDDLGTSYYFRGNITNNYVKFAGYYWRIIRINGDGSLRVIYDGTKAHTNSEESADRQIGESAYNRPNNATVGNYNADNAFVGYMNGTTNGTDFPSGGTNSTSYNEAHTNTTDSTIKSYIDNWYNTNIKNTQNANYVVDAIYCNDRARVTDATKIAELNNLLGITASGEGYSTYTTYYGFFNRVLEYYSSVTPTFKCTQNNDKFTVSNTIGNGKLTYPIGLISADEAIFGGIYYNAFKNDEVYLNNGSNVYWTMSPVFIYDNIISITCVGFSNTGSLYHLDNTYTTTAVRPVISLSPSGITDGNGTMSKPFIIGTGN